MGRLAKLLPSSLGLVADPKGERRDEERELYINREKVVGHELSEVKKKERSVFSFISSWASGLPRPLL